MTVALTAGVFFAVAALVVAVWALSVTMAMRQAVDRLAHDVHQELQGSHDYLAQLDHRLARLEARSTWVAARPAAKP